MSERDVMTALAEANPVRLSDLDAVTPVELLGTIRPRRRRPSRRVALAAAIALAALASTLIATFVVGGHQSSPSVGSEESSLFTATVAQPLPGGKEVTLSEGAAAIGQPIVLPTTSLVDPSDVGPVWVSGALPEVTTAVTFPSQGVFIDYTVPPPHDPSATYHAIARETPQSFETIDFNGGTALAVKQNSDQTGHNFGGVIFVLNGAEIRVFGHYDEQTLQSIAQSIVDRSGP